MTLTAHALAAVRKQALGQAVPSVTAALPVGSSEDGRSSLSAGGAVQAPGLTGLGTWTD